MEVFGNIESIKTTIEKKYLALMDEIEAKKRKELAKIEKAKQDKVDIIKEESSEKIEAESKVEKARIMNAGKMKAKAAFEKTREDMYEAVFEAVLKDAKKKVHSDKYLKFVKDQLPKGEKLKAFGDSTFYKKAFKDLKTDSKITGLRFEAGEVAYDFSIEAILEAKKDLLRNIISEVIFSGDVKSAPVKKPESKPKSTVKKSIKKPVKKNTKKTAAKKKK